MLVVVGVWWWWREGGGGVQVVSIVDVKHSYGKVKEQGDVQ